MEAAPEVLHAGSPGATAFVDAGLDTNTLTTTRLNLATTAPSSVETTATLLERFDTNAREAHSAIAASDEDYDVDVVADAGRIGAVFAPRGVIVRQHISHLSHRRGQLTVYLRLLDVPIPSIYGPTADEGWGG